MDWRHDQLVRDLADHLKGVTARMVWCDMQLGPSGSRRPDVFTMQKSFTKPRPLTYEVKASVADFRRDITSGKWQEYLKFSSGVTFATPAGLIGRDDIPRGCGLIVRGENGWKTVKAPTLNPVKLPEQALLKLLIDGVHREHVVRRGREYGEYIARQRSLKALGEEVAEILQDASVARAKTVEIEIRNEDRRKAFEDRHQQDVERRRRELNDIITPQIASLLGALGLDPDASAMAVRRRVSELTAQVDRDAVVSLLRSELENINRSLGRALTAARLDEDSKKGRVA